MDYFEIYNKGNNNMKQIHSCISEVAIQNSRLQKSLLKPK